MLDRLATDELKKRHIEWEKKRCIGEVAEVIFKNYEFKERPTYGLDVHPIYDIQLVVCNEKKFNECVGRIKMALSLRPEFADLKSLIMAIISEMDEPDLLNTEFNP